ncbi:MAG: 50S ribosomal protein P1 [Thaumarchaeota archaeon]|nr:50S ribosomal protein P1 [Nitrososphaerota archaeon]RLG07378.1 MAG: 50S ribosomal protein P1 [Nitrososphaerota archaeon]
MEYVYAALLLHRAGKEVSEENVKKVLSAAGINPDEARVKALVAALSEVNIDEVLKSATAMPVAAPAAAPAAAPQPAEEEKKPEAKEEKKKEEEKKEEEALAGLSALFG